jgi:lipopolysaccharide/colanic/teichoic acid biosynthesis glycosyltransferase
VFEDCYGEKFRDVLAFRPGIFGPNQVFFRNEGSLYPRAADPEEFYRGVLFPLKARTDLAYFPCRTLLRDMAWMIRGALAVVGWPSVSKQDVKLTEHIEAWIKRHQEFARDENAGA